MRLKVKRIGDVPMPEYAKEGDAGFDLRSTEDAVIAPGETKMLGTGIAVEIPEGYFGALVPRSGIASKRMLAPINTPGTIDSGYRGEIMVPLHNYAPTVVETTYQFDDGGPKRYLKVNDDAAQHVGRGERICQMIIVPYAKCDLTEVGELGESERGDGGFGSTGVR